MPAMLRNSKCEKIIWKILPKPLNLTEKKTKKEQYIDERLNMAWLARQR
jgi:hypothetical protein